jgi:hypothetical protein
LPLAKRNEIYTQAEKILLEDAGGVFPWHPVLTKLWKPTLVGSEFEAVDGTQRFLANEKLEIAEFQMYVAAG